MVIYYLKVFNENIYGSISGGKIRIAQTKNYEWIKVILFKKAMQKQPFPDLTYFLVKSNLVDWWNAGLLLDLAEFFIFLWQVKYLILKVENVSKSCQSTGKKYKNTDAKDHEANWVIWLTVWTNNFFKPFSHSDLRWGWQIHL